MSMATAIPYMSAILALVFSTCVSLQESPVTGKKRAYAYSWNDEVRMGREYDPQIIAEFGLLDHPGLTDYVRRVGETVLAESHLRRESTPPQFQNVPFTFRVLDSPVVNAFALPGGFNYVTRGLLAHLDNEAQLAMVLGHEVAHVAARHASQQALKQTAGSLFVLGGAVLTESVLGTGGQEVMQLGGAAAQLLFLSYSRDAERESDRLGVEYAAMAGYDAAEGADFFLSLKRISAAAGQRIPNHLSSHPDPGEREVDIQRRAARFREKGYAQEMVERDRFLAAIDGIMVGENPREGFVYGDAFVHPDLAFRFGIPTGWKVQNGRNAVLVYHPDQKAILQFTLDAEASTTAEVVDRIGNQQGITVVDRQAVSNSPIEAMRLIGEATDQAGNAIRLIVVGANLGGRLYRFVGYASKSEFDGYLAAFDSTALNFRPLTDPALLNVQPARLRVMTTTRSAAFREFIPNPMPVNLTAEDVAIMNQVNLDDIIPMGVKIKVPR
jgi:predicted Zn-dependent protease